MMADAAHPMAALWTYEDERLAVTSEIMETLTGGEPFDRINDVIDPAELAAISHRYKDIAGFRLDKETCRGPLSIASLRTGSIHPQR
jgi:hypothetical protein